MEFVKMNIFKTRKYRILLRNLKKTFVKITFFVTRFTVSRDQMECNSNAVRIIEK